MEPLHPRDREALKRANPGLTDDEIDRTEELIAQSEHLDDLGRPAEAERLRAELSAFVQQRIPRYGEVMRDAAISQRSEAKRRHITPRVFEKPR